MSDKKGPYTADNCEPFKKAAQDKMVIFGLPGFRRAYPTLFSVIIDTMNAVHELAYAAGAASKEPPDPDAHLADAEYLKAKQARFAEQPQSAEEREAYHAVNEASNELMWGKDQEPSKELTDEVCDDMMDKMCDSYRNLWEKSPKAIRPKAPEAYGSGFSHGMLYARDNGYLPPSKAILLPMSEEDIGVVADNWKLQQQVWGIGQARP